MKMVLSDIWRGRIEYEIDETAWNDIVKYCQEHRKSCILKEVQK